MKTFNTNFCDFSRDIYLRNDVKYHNFVNNTNWNLFNSDNYIKLKDILISDYENFNFEDSQEYYGIPTGQSYIDEDGYIIDNQLITKEERPNRLKYKINKNNILISSLRLARSPALNFENIDFNKYVFSNGFYIFYIKNWNKKFILYLLRNQKIKFTIDNCIYRGIGISAYKDNDLLNIKIPLIPLSTQNEIVEKIKSIEEKIASLKAKIKDQKLVINEVFVREFGFNVKEFEQIKRNEKINTVNFYNFSLNKDLRNSAKFHRKSYNYLIEFCKNKNFKALKNFVSESIVLGASISQDDIDENGDYNYISMAELKNYTINLENVKKINKNFYDKKIDKSIKNNDIIIARSGEGTIGKCAIIEDTDIEGICADFTMRIRINNNIYNSKFAYYYFCSFIFQYMVEVNKKGLGNNTNFFPTQLQDFLIPDISLPKQQAVVDEIKAEIDKQNEINKTVACERKKIDELIESVLK